LAYVNSAALRFKIKENIETKLCPRNAISEIRFRLIDRKKPKHRKERDENGKKQLPHCDKRGQIICQESQLYNQDLKYLIDDINLSNW
jgi:hypothetical protein